jgi:hypothetical protein
VITAVPADIPTATPVDPPMVATVQIAGDPLDHVPPAVGSMRTEVAPMQIPVTPDIDPTEITVIATESKTVDGTAQARLLVIEAITWSLPDSV